jgi:hypothetical protein
MVGVAHELYRHYVGAFPVGLQFLIFFYSFHNLLQFSIIPVWDVKVVGHLTIAPCK